MKSQYVNIQKPRRKGPVAAWPEEYCHLSSHHLGDRNWLHKFQTNSVKIHKFYFIGYSLPSYPEVCMSGWGELWWLTGFRSFLNLSRFLTLLMFLLIDMLIMSGSRNKAHHNATFHTLQWSQVNRSALLRKNHAENDEVGKPYDSWQRTWNQCGTRGTLARLCHLSPWGRIESGPRNDPFSGLRLSQGFGSGTEVAFTGPCHSTRRRLSQQIRTHKTSEVCAVMSYSWICLTYKNQYYI